MYLSSEPAPRTDLHESDAPFRVDDATLAQRSMLICIQLGLQLTRSTNVGNEEVS
ncbi:hypothetical protein Mal52_28020 [Symmachiella dynata]|uniref:Uncharacterized protein n=1 Tax=Symmachiella dynata TaxID=2527995 RepID=A0A517ZPC0_9PLAN|nr:hypothetical protein Mal52_28020 [Symmachiella dynata]